MVLFGFAVYLFGFALSSLSPWVLLRACVANFRCWFVLCFLVPIWFRLAFIECCVVFHWCYCCLFCLLVLNYVSRVSFVSALFPRF